MPRGYASGVRLTVRVTPRAGSDELRGFDAEGRLNVRVAAAPTDGEANAAVVKLLAKALGLPARDVTLVSGATARIKAFEIPLDMSEVDHRLRQPHKP